jgi:hypothetical protein
VSGRKAPTPYAGELKPPPPPAPPRLRDVTTDRTEAAKRTAAELAREWRGEIDGLKKAAAGHGNALQLDLLESFITDLLDAFDVEGWRRP